MPTLVPAATYSSPSESKPTISDVVISAGGEDRDKPTPASKTPLGSLRAQLTTIQDQLNVFLTEKMSNKRKHEDDDVERRILDEGIDEDSD
ncbi:hypothetical protein CA7LBN_002494 [Candidozyma auris]|uniref:EKC/KEOPS complex subunit GON7 n=1 Tax=Candidozyma auris TaxID=498019 RepID=A0A8F3AGF1_CANAR|nr:hypothetical protein CA7LBN_002494 [[Candida] auris]